jgi:hypothetical protein
VITPNESGKYVSVASMGPTRTGERPKLNGLNDNIDEVLLNVRVLLRTR